MNKLVFVFVAILLLFSASCNKDEYKVIIPDNYAVNELKPSYSVGETVTIVLHTATEQYYRLFVNGEELKACSIDMEYTYFTFIMPDRDVIVEIVAQSVDIPYEIPK